MLTTLPDLWSLTLVVLAVYRLAYLLTEENGPGNIFLRFRCFMHLKFPVWVGEGFSCFFCESFWFSLAGVLAIHPALDLTLIFLWFAVSALVGLLRRAELRIDLLGSAAARAASKK